MPACLHDLSMCEWLSQCLRAPGYIILQLQQDGLRWTFSFRVLDISQGRDRNKVWKSSNYYSGRAAMIRNIDLHCLFIIDRRKWKLKVWINTKADVCFYLLLIDCSWWIKKSSLEMGKSSPAKLQTILKSHWSLWQVKVYKDIRATHNHLQNRRYNVYQYNV